MLKQFRRDIDILREKQRLINTYVENYYDKSAEKDYLNFFISIINKLVNGERSSIFISDMENELVWLEAGTGIERKQITVPKDSSMVGRVISSGKPEINNNMAVQEGAHKGVDSATGFSTRNAICVPVKSLDRERVTGAIQVLNKENGGVFNEDDQKWLENIAEHMQSYIEHVYLNQETLSVMDKVCDNFSKLLTIFGVITLLSMTGFIIISAITYGLLSN